MKQSPTKSRISTLPKIVVFFEQQPLFKNFISLSCWIRDQPTLRNDTWGNNLIWLNWKRCKEETCRINHCAAVFPALNAYSKSPAQCDEGSLLVAAGRAFSSSLEKNVGTYFGGFEKPCSGEHMRHCYRAFEKSSIRGQGVWGDLFSQNEMFSYLAEFHHILFYYTEFAILYLLLIGFRLFLLVQGLRGSPWGLNSND